MTAFGKTARRVTGALKIAAAEAGFARLIIVGTPGPVPIDVEGGALRRVWPVRFMRVSSPDATAYKRQLDGYGFSDSHAAIVHFNAWGESAEAVESMIAAAETFIEHAHGRLRRKWFDCPPEEASRVAETMGAAKGGLFGEEEYWRRIEAAARDISKLLRGARG